MLFSGAKWVIEGDIQACFDSFDHHVMVNILRKKIHDEQFLDLIWKMLRAGYMEQWTYHDTFSGTPQGSGVSPILANIYLSKLDIFIENYKAVFDTPKGKRKLSSEYRAAQYRNKTCKERLAVHENHKAAVANFKRTQKEMLSIPSYPIMDALYVYIAPKELSAEDETVLQDYIGNDDVYVQGVREGWIILFLGDDQKYYILPGIHEKQSLIELIPSSIRNRKDGITYYNLDITAVSPCVKVQPGQSGMRCAK